MPLIFGCGGQNPVKIVLPPDFGEGHQPQSAASPKRFEKPASSGANAIEAAVEMSEKYAKLSAEATELKQKNEGLQQQNLEMQTKLQQSQTELERAQKELKEANDLIMETKVELNNWKADVLGFREEMRQADIAQLQTLQKVVELLGGEVPQQVAADTTVEPRPTVKDPNTTQKN